MFVSFTRACPDLSPVAPGALEIWSIILAISSFITGVGAAAASVYFYTQAMSLQRKSDEALAEIREKSSSLQDQVGGMNERLLDAALSRRAVSESFSTVEAEIGSAPAELMKRIEQAIGEVSAEQQASIEGALSDHMQRIEGALERTQRATTSAMAPSAKGVVFGEITDDLQDAGRSSRRR